MNEMTRTGGQLPSKVERRRERIEFMLLDQQMILNGMPYAWSTVASGDVDSSNKNLVEILDELRFFVQEHGIDLTRYENIVDEYLERLSGTGGAAFNKFLPQAAQQQGHSQSLQHDGRGEDRTEHAKDAGRPRQQLRQHHPGPDPDDPAHQAQRQ